MIVLSHRGLWQHTSEKNTAVAFSRSFEAGFGTETDIRDWHGELVISHDMPTGSEMRLTDFLDLLGNRRLPLALNIKSDGLAEPIAELMAKRSNADWFVFDMSVPDQRHHLAIGNPVFTRLSEVEQPVWLSTSRGVWLDAFEGGWFGNALVEELLGQEKQICIVSPELHGRDPQPLWQQLALLPQHPGLMLCTDQPLAARHFFREQI